MPIEFFSPISGGAIATVIRHTAAEFLQSGHQVSVLTTLDGNPTYSVGTVVKIEYKKSEEFAVLPRVLSRIRGKLNGFDWPCFDYFLRSVVWGVRSLRTEPEVIIIYNDLASSEFLRRVIPRAKIIVWLHNECRTRHNIDRTIQATDLFVVNSGYIREWTIATHGIPRNRFVVALNGVDLKAFRPRDAYRSEKLPVKVLFIGRIDPNKGPDIVADAVATLRREGLQVSLTVAGGLWFYGNGDPSSNPYFRTLRTKMDSAEADYLGHVDRHAIPQIVRMHDVVCVLSRTNEPFGLVVLEAMASGCAVIASRRGGLPEACGDAGILVDERDFRTVCDKLRSLVQERNQLNDRKEESLARAAVQSWSECAKVLETAIKKL